MNQAWAAYPANGRDQRCVEPSGSPVPIDVVGGLGNGTRVTRKRCQNRRSGDGQVAGASSTATLETAGRKAPSRQAMNSATETTATMIVEIALIWGVTPNLIEL